MRTEMQAKLESMHKGTDESVDREKEMNPVYMALVISYEGLLLQKQALETCKHIEEHMAKLAGTVTEKFSTERGASLKDKVPALRASF